MRTLRNIFALRPLGIFGSLFLVAGLACWNYYGISDYYIPNWIIWLPLVYLFLCMCFSVFFPPVKND